MYSLGNPMDVSKNDLHGGIDLGQAHRAHMRKQLYTQRPIRQEERILLLLRSFLF
jgi:hypothetical protein